MSSNTSPLDVATWAQIAWDGHEIHVARVEDTHTSRVFLSDEFAFKVRRPVDFGFVSYESRSDRWNALCHELELGLRMSPSVYVDVLSLNPAQQELCSSPSRHGEPVLVMKLLPEENRLDRVLDRGEPVAVERIAHAVASLHSAAPQTDVAKRFGRIDVVRQSWEVSFTEVPEGDESFPLSRSERSELLDWASRWLDRNAELIEERRRSGYVRELHGDLHAEHVYLLDDAVQFIDPLEFSDDLRIIDTGSDACFLAVDLEVRGANLGDQFLSVYAKAASDQGVKRCAPFWMTYRATVRAKVLYFRSSGAQGSHRTRLLRHARRYLNRALDRVRA